MPNELEVLKDELTEYFTSHMQESTHPEFSSPARHLQIHPSGGRYCPLRDIYTWVTDPLSFQRDATFAGVYFMNVGTLVHELIQRFAAKGGRIWGHWKCQHSPACSYATDDIQPYHDCPRCGSACDYEEVGFLLNKEGELLTSKKSALLDGHSDGLYGEQPCSGG